MTENERMQMLSENAGLNSQQAEIAKYSAVKTEEPVTRLFCERCNTELQPGAQCCPACRAKTAKGKNKTLRNIIITLVCVILVGAVGVFGFLKFSAANKDKVILGTWEATASFVDGKYSPNPTSSEYPSLKITADHKAVVTIGSNVLNYTWAPYETEDSDEENPDYLLTRDTGGTTAIRYFKKDGKIMMYISSSIVAYFEKV